MGVLKADFENSNEITPQSAKPNRLCDFGFAIPFIGLRPFASFCVVFRFDVTRNVTHIDHREERYAVWRAPLSQNSDFAYDYNSGYFYAAIGLTGIPGESRTSEPRFSTNRGALA